MDKELVTPQVKLKNTDRGTGKEDMKVDTVVTAALSRKFHFISFLPEDKPKQIDKVYLHLGNT